MCENVSIDNSVLTCVHVINDHVKYEYVQEDKKIGACESFTCSNCLELNATNKNKAMKNLMIVCRECFIKSRIKGEDLT